LAKHHGAIGVSVPEVVPDWMENLAKYWSEGRICDCLFHALKSLRFSYAAFDFVYSPCVLVSRRLQPLRIAIHKPGALFESRPSRK
jgi:hypothetical protein